MCNRLHMDEDKVGENEPGDQGKSGSGTVLTKTKNLS